MLGGVGFSVTLCFIGPNPTTCPPKNEWKTSVYWGLKRGISKNSQCRIRRCIEKWKGGMAGSREMPHNPSAPSLYSMRRVMNREKQTIHAPRPCTPRNTSNAALDIVFKANSETTESQATRLIS